MPHFLPGKNPFVKDFAKKFGLPFDAVFGGAEDNISGVHDENRTGGKPGANAV